MAEKKKIIGYNTNDGHIYCVECINKEREIMKKIEKVITTKDSEKNLYFCDLCDERIK